MGNPVIHFELIGPDPARLREFYGALFGWTFEVGKPEMGYYTNCNLRDRRAAGSTHAAQPAVAVFRMGPKWRERSAAAWTTALASWASRPTVGCCLS